MEKIMAWCKASRIPAQMFIFPSLLLGQGLFYSVYGTIDWQQFFMIHIYGIFMHLFIVYANDYADFETDKLNRTFTTFTGGSRVLVEGVLKRNSLLRAAIFMYFLSVITGIIISFYINNWLTLLLIIFGLKLLWAYSFKPIQLSYRGFGEVLQVIGVGVVLPLVGYIGQGGELMYLPWYVIAILLPAQMGMAVSTSLPDKPSDELSLKRTTVVIIGDIKSKYLIITLNLTTLLAVYLFISRLYPCRNIYLLFSPLYIIVLLQVILSAMYPLEPGSKPLYFFVLLSIITNVASILLLTYILTTG